MPIERSERRKLAAIMFTDMVGYSALAQKNEALALKLLDEHRRLLRPLFPRHNGAEIKTIGDAFLVEFTSALDAVQCAAEMQKILAERNASSRDAIKIQIRIGLHLGDVVYRENDVLGDGSTLPRELSRWQNRAGFASASKFSIKSTTSSPPRSLKLAPLI